MPAKPKSRAKALAARDDADDDTADAVDAGALDRACATIAEKVRHARGADFQLSHDAVGPERARERARCRSDARGDVATSGEGRRIGGDARVEASEEGFGTLSSRVWETATRRRRRIDGDDRVE